MPKNEREEISGKGETVLVGRARAGDRSAFDHLYSMWMTPLRNFLRHRVAQQSVDDVMQETLIAAWAGLPRYVPRPQATLSTWMYQIARYKAADWARGNAKQAARETPITPADEERIAAPDTASSIEQDTEIAALLKTLSPEQHELLELHYAHGLTLAQIAERQGRNLSTVKYHFYRAQNALSLARIAREKEANL